VRKDLLWLLVIKCINGEVIDMSSTLSALSVLFVCGLCSLGLGYLLYRAIINIIREIKKK